jgi:hypothetical protein
VLADGAQGLDHLAVDGPVGKAQGFCSLLISHALFPAHPIDLLALRRQLADGRFERLLTLPDIQREVGQVIGTTGEPKDLIEDLAFPAGTADMVEHLVAGDDKQLTGDGFCGVDAFRMFPETDKNVVDNVFGDFRGFDDLMGKGV